MFLDTAPLLELQVYVILLIHYHLTSCLFVCFLFFFLLFFFFFFFFVAASSASILWKNEIIKFPFFFFIRNDVGCPNHSKVSCCIFT